MSKNRRGPSTKSSRTWAFIQATLAAALLGLAVPLGSTAAHAVQASDFEGDRGFAYEAFDRLDRTEISEGGAKISVGLVPDSTFALDKQQLVAWVRRSARAVTMYYGKFPAPTARVLLMSADADSVTTGSTWGYRGAATRVEVGNAADQAALDRDWVMVHEMIHMALPEVAQQHGWLSEGLAVYVESIARVQAGDLKPEFIWAEFARAMPKGQPKDGDQGLDNTPTWGRRYWGGAIFCLLADVELRKRSNNRIGLQTALRGINAIANHTDEWPIDKVLAAGDAATGLPVLAELYAKMRDEPSPAELDKLWRELGVTIEGRTAKLNDAAPLAAIRRAITAPM
jgi:hypothetical protein